MKNFKILLVIVLSFLITAGVVSALKVDMSVDELKQLTGQEAPQEDLGGTFSGNNFAVIATTTSATQNKMILDINTSRKYALFQNNSDTLQCYYWGYFASEVLASTTQMQNTPYFCLNANGGTYEINYDNLYTGQVWLATTTAGKDVNGFVSQKTYTTLNPTNTY